MRASIIPSQILLPRSSVKLGRFITNLAYPYQHYHDPLVNQPSTLISTWSGYSGDSHAARDTGFHSTLTSLLSTRFSRSTNFRVKLTTENVRTYSLDNSDAWFEEATRLPPTRAWIEHAIERGHDIYMVVGYHTLTNAGIHQEEMAGSLSGGHAKVPNSLTLAAAGAVVPLADLVNLSVDSQQTQWKGAQSSFMAPGEQICAIEYRKIRYAWLSSKDIDKSRLSDVRQWSTLENARDEEDGEDDLIKVEFEELVENPDGEWDKEVVEDIVLFYPLS